MHTIDSYPAENLPREIRGNISSEAQVRIVIAELSEKNEITENGLLDYQETDILQAKAMGGEGVVFENGAEAVRFLRELADES